jgi:hypothetical protein
LRPSQGQQRGYGQGHNSQQECLLFQTVPPRQQFQTAQKFRQANKFYRPSMEM